MPRVDESYLQSRRRQIMDAAMSCIVVRWNPSREKQEIAASMI